MCTKRSKHQKCEKLTDKVTFAAKLKNHNFCALTEFIIPIVSENVHELIKLSFVSKDFQRAVLCQPCILDVGQARTPDDYGPSVNQIMPALESFSNIRKLRVNIKQIEQAFFDENEWEQNPFMRSSRPINLCAIRFLIYLQSSTQLRHSLQHIEIHDGASPNGNFHEIWENMKTYDTLKKSSIKCIKDKLNDNDNDSNAERNIAENTIVTITDAIFGQISTTLFDDDQEIHNITFPNVTLYFFGGIVDAQQMSFISQKFPSLRVFDCWACTFTANASQLVRFSKKLQVMNFYQAAFDDGLELEKYIDCKNLIAFFAAYGDISTQQCIKLIEKVVSQSDKTKLKAFSLPYDMIVARHQCYQQLYDKFEQSTDLTNRGKL